MHRFFSALACFLALLPAACGTSGGKADAGNDQDGNGGPLECQRWVLQDEVINARDLGAQPLSGGNYVACGRIFRGGDPGDLTRTGCQEFSELGILTVFDLRTESYQQANPPIGCVTIQANVVSAPLPKLSPSAENYVALLNETDSMAKIFTTLGQAPAYPVYIHCRIGRDRASTVTALVLLTLGAERQTVIDEFMLNNEAGVTVEQKYIEAVLDEIDQRGGIVSYLKDIGITDNQIRVLRQESID